MKHLLTLSCIGAALLLFASCGNNNSRKAASSNNGETAELAEADSLKANEQTAITMDKIATLAEEPIFEIVTSVGVIKVKLYADTPLHRANFAKLAFEKYYDGVLFHRVIKDFMIQTGDPLSKDAKNKSMFGTGGPDYTIPAEILPNHEHKKGALAAARRGDAANPRRESSGSQFYIVQNDEGTPFLDGAYTVFGETLEGLDVVDKIAAVATDGRDCPLQDVKIITIKLAE